MEDRGARRITVTRGGSGLRHFTWFRVIGYDAVIKAECGGAVRGNQRRNVMLSFTPPNPEERDDGFCRVISALCATVCRFVHVCRDLFLEILFLAYIVYADLYSRELLRTYIYREHVWDSLQDVNTYNFGWITQKEGKRWRA